jgi:hypothetical protein
MPSEGVLYPYVGYYPIADVHVCMVASELAQQTLCHGPCLSHAAVVCFACCCNRRAWESGLTCAAFATVIFSLSTLQVRSRGSAQQSGSGLQLLSHHQLAGGCYDLAVYFRSKLSVRILLNFHSVWSS